MGLLYLYNYEKMFYNFNNQKALFLTQNRAFHLNKTNQTSSSFRVLTWYIVLLEQTVLPNYLKAK